MTQPPRPVPTGDALPDRYSTIDRDPFAGEALPPLDDVIDPEEQFPDGEAAPWEDLPAPPRRGPPPLAPLSAAEVQRSREQAPAVRETSPRVPVAPSSPPAAVRSAAPPRPVTPPVVPAATQDRPQRSGRKERRPRSRLTPNDKLSNVEREQRNRALEAVFSRFIALRDTIQGLEAEKNELAEYIKEHVLAGDTAVVMDMKPVVVPNRKRVIPFDVFRETFGEELAATCATIDVKAADALVTRGEVSADALKGITGYVETKPALYVRPAVDGPQGGEKRERP